MTTKNRKRLASITCGVLMFVCGATTVLLQTRIYPKEIRGYKVERTVVEVKKPEKKNQKSGNDNAPLQNDRPEPADVLVLVGLASWRQSTRQIDV